MVRVSSPTPLPDKFRGIDMNNIMLDLETLGNGSNSVIISIGAVKFDPKTKQLGSEFYANVDAESCVKAGLKMDVSTVLWWMQQSDQARSVFKNKGLTLINALVGFSDWIGDKKNTLVWGNGANFDNVILSNAYKAVGLEQPWPYWGDRCYRTIKALNPNVKADRIGTHHNALDDAKTQAIHLMDML